MAVGRVSILNLFISLIFKNTIIILPPFRLQLLLLFNALLLQMSK